MEDMSVTPFPCMNAISPETPWVRCPRIKGVASLSRKILKLQVGTECNPPKLLPRLVS